MKFLNTNYDIINKNNYLDNNGHNFPQNDLIDIKVIYIMQGM